MPHQLLVEFPGALYHVMSRGDRREAISTGIVNDEVFELKMEPKNWGEWGFRN